jgi:hypothetical protein
MNRRPLSTLIVLAIVIALVVVGHYFGWLRQAPPLIAPGIQ